MNFLVPAGWCCWWIHRAAKDRRFLCTTATSNRCWTRPASSTLWLSLVSCRNVSLFHTDYCGVFFLSAKHISITKAKAETCNLNRRITNYCLCRQLSHKHSLTQSGHGTEGQEKDIKKPNRLTHVPDMFSLSLCSCSCCHTSSWYSSTASHA